MREKIAKILTRFEGTAFYPYGSSVVETRSQEILALISEEIEKMRNPYPDTMAFRISHPAFEDCRQAILKILEEK